MKDLLLITPPFTQLNTPYPGTAYLKGFLNTKGIASHQMDLGVEVILAVFSKQGLADLFDEAKSKGLIKSENELRIFALRRRYILIIDEVITFLQGRNQTFARQLVTTDFLPQASRFDQAEDLEWAFGNMGMQDKAKHLATLFLEDISDFIVACVDPHFGFSRYAERLGMSASSFDELSAELQADPSFIDKISLSILKKKMEAICPKLACFSVPFPGNLYSGFRAAQFIKANYPTVKIAMGGGFPNTELRSLKDPRVFDYFDFVSLDDGELPIELLVDQVLGNATDEIDLKRTFRLQDGVVQYCNTSKRADYKQSDLGTPDYSDLLLDKYVSVIEVTNPMHSLWSDGRWLKLTMAHGCYWGKCTFCDISLDYIKLYEPIAANILVDRMEELMASTGERGFHFVDEAAPPVLMRAVALEILRRGLNLSWWTNIRFEKSFSADLCRLLKASGCIAVSGGLEVASDRLLALIDKGVTVEQVAQVCRNLTEAGIMTHAYLMYGYPTQTEQETVDSLEMVRQLFEQGVVQSGFWHQFALTAHSPIGMDPEVYGVIPHTKEIKFAENDIEFEDKTGIDHNQFSFGLKKSLLNYMNGIGFDYPLQFWFENDIPKSSIKKHHIKEALTQTNSSEEASHSKIIWIGEDPLTEEFVGKKNVPMMRFTFHDAIATEELNLPIEKAKWFVQMLHKSQVSENKPMTYGEWKSDYEKSFGSFAVFWKSDDLVAVKACGLLVL